MKLSYCWSALLGAIRKNTKLKILLLLGPPVTYLIVLFYAPFGLVVMYSLNVIDTKRHFVLEPTLQYYQDIVAMAGMLEVFERTIFYAVATTALCLLIGYPLAYYISFKAKRHKGTLLLLFMTPVWLGLLLRTYSLMVILSEKGPLNAILIQLGVIGEPLRLLYGQSAVIIGMVYTYLPLMVLPLYGSIEKLDKELLEASATLGAGPVSTFIRTTLPLTMPGIFAGSILVFIPVSGEFIIPSLLGGPYTYTIGNFIYTIFLYARNWWLGSAVSLLFITFIIALVFVYFKFFVREELAIATV